MSITAPFTERSRSLLAISRFSIANPPWFATPVDAQEDEESVTVVFHVPGNDNGELRVQASDRSVTVRGDSGAMRLCALPHVVDTSGVKTSRSEELLRVRIAKKRPKTRSKGSSSQAECT